MLFESMSIVWSLMLVVLASEAHPTVTGSIANELRGDDLRTILKLAQNGRGDPWLLLAKRNHPISRDTWIVTAFLEPESESGRVRKGSALLFISAAPAEGAPRDWRPAKHVMTYGQVAIRDEFSNRKLNTRHRERPFILEGNIKDSELIALVDFIRTGPSQAPLVEDSEQFIFSSACKIDGRLPIASISSESPHLFEVILEDDEWSGQTARIGLFGTTWKMIECGFWNA